MIDYINNYDYLIDHLETLKLNHQEILVLLVIENYNKRGLKINVNDLARKLCLSKEELIAIMEALSQQHHLLTLDSETSKFDYTIDVHKPQSTTSSSIIQLVEKICGRDLSYLEIKRLESWQGRYTPETIIYALREIKDHQGLNLNLIESVLEAKHGGK